MPGALLGGYVTSLSHNSTVREILDTDSFTDRRGLGVEKFNTLPGPRSHEVVIPYMTAFCFKHCDNPTPRMWLFKYSWAQISLN